MTTIVTLDETKTFLGVEHDGADASITRMIESAQEALERRLRMAFISRNETMVLDEFPLRLPFIEFEYWPVTAIVSFNYYTPQDVETEWAESNYFIDETSKPARIILKNGVYWPSNIRPALASKIVYTVGYGATAADVPARFKQTLLNVVKRFYDDENDKGFIVELQDKDFALIEGDMPAPLVMHRVGR